MTTPSVTTESKVTRRNAKDGRPTKFTPDTVKNILKCLGQGMPLSLAARAAGINPLTLTVWRRKHPAFDEAAARAIARGVEKRLKKIEDASEAGDWRAAAWLLEHCQPEHFARNRVEVTGADGAPLAAAVAIYLPQKDGDKPIVDVNPSKQIQNHESR
jgi:transposase-like protein